MKVTISHDELEAFKASWPAHGIPDKVYFIAFEFRNENGDLAGIECFDDQLQPVWEGDDSGAALAALADDAKGKAKEDGAWNY